MSESTDVAMSEPIDEVEASRMPLLDHLRELRSRLIKVVGALLVGMALSLFFTDQILHFLTFPADAALKEANVRGGLAIVNSPFEGVYVWLRTAFLGGVFVSSPFTTYQLWAFIAPGLYANEKRLVVPLSLASTTLFISGGAFAYYIIFPLAFPFFFTVMSDTDVSLSIEGYLSAVVRMMLAFGICFQLPVVTFFIARMGLIDHKDMIKGFRYAVVGIFVIAAILTPPEVLTQVALAIPLVLLYGVGIIVAKFASTKKRP